MIKISQKLKSQLWWLIISVDYDYSRIAIAEHDLTDEVFTLWLEDKQDFKNSIDECLQVDIRIRDVARVIKTENLNSYEGTKLHPTKNFAYKARIEINTPLLWYKDDASLVEQQWTRETLLKTLLTQLVEAGALNDYEY
ncbi:hypothetical protein MTO98_10040 [Mucilaginibacter sp. SMC90]|uniref:hypothetical protein n=1 Tax=Mucilaginibacter sp. SMC90 TaxID=2929803 RepID=UPI001FB5383A|nr:hypothetical protein [Mucilaginibacter sp. SMC90]UOE51416.1 hypothetical protein MTO98_10040 [Mucilaginibacter sp. SMC90]